MNAIDILKYGHQTVLQSLEGLPESEWETGSVCGVWSVKNIMAHLASYEWLLVDVLNTFLGGDPTPYLEKVGAMDPDRFNDDEVGSRQGKTGLETLTEYTETQTKTMELAAQIPPETFRRVGTLPWYGTEYSLDDFLVYTYYGHKREHCAQINVFKDSLKG
jgi:hypothetical protein